MTIEYITKQTLLEELGIHTSTLDRFVNDGLINKYKINRRVWFKVSEIEKMFENHKIKGNQNNG